MKWKNLLNNKCPQCSKDLKFLENMLAVYCPCGFKISADRMQEIVSDLNNRSFDLTSRIESERENQELLNEL